MQPIRRIQKAWKISNELDDGLDVIGEIIGFTILRYYG